jgi:hypothetical protein
MMTLQGAARAPSGAHPRVVVALSPPSDFVDLAAWTDHDLPAVYPRPADVEAFFSPYWRRIAPDLGRMPTVASASPFYRPEGLCPMLAQDTWVLHDDWDTLIPVRQSEALAAACPAHVRPIFWRRQTPTDFSVIGLDHGAFGREEVVPSSLSFTMAAIVGTLTPPAATSWIGVVHVPTLEVFLGTVHDEQRASGDTTYAIAPLLALADPRARLLDPGDGSVTPAGDAVATAVNAVWGTTFDAAGVRAQLAIGLPSP